MRAGYHIPKQPNWDCVVIFALLILVTILVILFGHPANGAPQKSSGSATKLLRVYKPGGDWCARCKVVEAELVRRGATLVKVCRVIKEPPYYPLCVYSDGAYDSGDRVLTGQCGFASKVYVITVMEASEKKR